MSRGRHVRGVFVWLSLTAALLLALLPSAGRLAASHEAGPRTLLMEMCTMGSETRISMVDPFDLQDAPSPAPTPPDHGDMPDCAYCPLLATTLIAVLWLAWSPTPRATPRATRMQTPRVSARPPCGLGSRGPPLAA